MSSAFKKHIMRMTESGEGPCILKEAVSDPALPRLLSVTVCSRHKCKSIKEKAVLTDSQTTKAIRYLDLQKERAVLIKTRPALSYQLSVQF